MKKTILYAILTLLLVQAVSAVEVKISDYDPKPAEAGEYLNVWIKVENPSNSAYQDGLITIVPKDGLELSPGEDPDQNIGIIKARSYDTFQYRLLVTKDAYEGPNMIEVLLNKDGTEVSYDLPLEVVDKDFKEIDLDVALVDSDPIRIKPNDEDVRLDVSLFNLGDTVAKGVTAELRGLPEGVTFTESYSSKALVGNIDDDDTAVATYYIDVDEEVVPGMYELELHTKYKYKPDEDEDDYVIENVVLPVELKIKPVPIYEIVDVEFSPATLQAGMKKVNMLLTVKNVGEEEGESVRVKVYGKTEQPFTYDVSTNFVAPKLEPGESAQATLEFDIEDDAPLQTYSLDLEIRNIVDDDILTYDRTVDVVVSLPKKKQPIKLIIAGAVVLGVIVGIYFITRKKKKTTHQPRRIKKSFERE